MNSRPSEFSLISKYFAPLSGETGFNFGDDAALLPKLENTRLVITQDAIAETVHFFSDDTPDLIARKAIRVNLSDLAAKGATPRYISLALGLGNTWNEAWVDRFAQGFAADCKTYNLELTGGDTFRTGGGFVISITAMGEIAKDGYVSRLGARVGDVLCVTGTIGDAAIGLHVRQGGLGKLLQSHRQALIDRYLLPQPRTSFAHLIRDHASAAMDISDGLLGDLEKLCAVSRVGCDIRLDDIPLSKALNAAIELESSSLETALSGGDDYEILFTVPEENLKAFDKATSLEDIRISKIGQITSGGPVKVFDTGGEVVEFAKKSYDHCGETP